MTAYDVSVIVATFNEEENIANCLSSVRAQAYPQEKIEIIVVDNGSSDRTKSISRRYTDKVYDCGPERSAQRNFGVRQASGKYILYLDADMVLSGEVISECLERCEKEALTALYIPEKITGEGFWIRVRDFERSFYNATDVDCVRFVQREAFLGIGGFDEGLTGPEDWDFDRRIRAAGRVSIVKRPIYHNEGAFNLSRYLKKKAYYARSFDSYVKKWGRSDPSVKRQLGVWYRYIGIFTENKKWKKLLSHPILAMAMIYLRVMVGAVAMGR